MSEMGFFFTLQVMWKRERGEGGCLPRYETAVAPRPVAILTGPTSKLFNILYGVEWGGKEQKGQECVCEERGAGTMMTGGGITYCSTMSLSSSTVKILYPRCWANERIIQYKDCMRVRC